MNRDVNNVAVLKVANSAEQVLVADSYCDARLFEIAPEVRELSLEDYENAMKIWAKEAGKEIVSIKRQNLGLVTKKGLEDLGLTAQKDSNGHKYRAYHTRLIGYCKEVRR